MQQPPHEVPRLIPCSGLAPAMAVVAWGGVGYVGGLGCDVSKPHFTFCFSCSMLPRQAKCKTPSAPSPQQPYLRCPWPLPGTAGPCAAETPPCWQPATLGCLGPACRRHCTAGVDLAACGCTSACWGLRGKQVQRRQAAARAGRARAGRQPGLRTRPAALLLSRHRRPHPSPAKLAKEVRVSRQGAAGEVPAAVGGAVAQPRPPHCPLTLVSCAAATSCPCLFCQLVQARGMAHDGSAWSPGCWPPANSHHMPVTSNNTAAAVYSLGGRWCGSHSCCVMVLAQGCRKPGAATESEMERWSDARHTASPVRCSS